jgi:cytochrome c553
MQLDMTKSALATLSLMLLISCFSVNAETKNKENISQSDAVEKAEKSVRKAEKMIEEAGEIVKNAEKIVKEAEEDIDGLLHILNCSECHGFDGNSSDQAKPNLAGLNEQYIIRQLDAFKEGTRIDEDMEQVVREIPSDKELQGLAIYFSKQKMINKNTPKSIKNHELVDLKIGKEIFTGKRIEYGIPACSACHGKDGMGDEEGKYPRLMGQNMDYIIKQMELFRSKDRSNDTPPQMRGIAGLMDDEDIASVAAYIAYMKP